MRGSISTPGANTHRSLNSVTVSASSISGPFASTTVTADATFTRLVADDPLVGSSATLRVWVASAVTVVDAKGPEMDEAETVTLFNDLCVFAPGVLIDPRIQWQVIDPHTVSVS